MVRKEWPRLDSNQHYQLMRLNFNRSNPYHYYRFRRTSTECLFLFLAILVGKERIERSLQIFKFAFYRSNSYLCYHFIEENRQSVLIFFPIFIVLRDG